MPVEDVATDAGLGRDILEAGRGEAGSRECACCREEDLLSALRTWEQSPSPWRRLLTSHRRLRRGRILPRTLHRQLRPRLLKAAY
jgi:hypothetical protein